MYKYNKKQSKLPTILVYCVIGALVGFYVGYMAFVWGFVQGANFDYRNTNTQKTVRLNIDARTGAITIAE